MRKVLILMALLPSLAFADSVSGPVQNQTPQTASPQNGAATLNVLQPAPGASEQGLSAPTQPINALQGSTPTSADKLEIIGDGAPQPLSSQGLSQVMVTWLLLAAFLVLAATAYAVWFFNIRKSQLP